MEGITEARAINKQVNDLLIKEGISIDNYMQWQMFLRSVRTVLDLLQEEVDALQAFKTKEC